MTVTVHWHDSTAIVLRFEGDWTWDMYFSARTHLYHLLMNVAHNVDYIYDFTETGVMPDDTPDMIDEVARARHPHATGLLIIVADSDTTHAVSLAFSPIFATNQMTLRFVTDMDEMAMSRTRYHNHRQNGNAANRQL